MDVLSLGADFYTDPAIHDHERAVIFRGTWQFVAIASSLDQPGAYRSLQIADMGVFVIRGHDGVLRGFQNVCRHRGSQLFDTESGTCEAIRCPYHGWTYDDRGALIATPWFGETTPFELDQWPLNPIAVEQWRGLVFVAIDPSESLAEQLGSLPVALADTPFESFHHVHSERLQAPVNWKVYLEQFNEYYHVPLVHRPTQGIGLERYSAIAGENMSCMMAPADSASYGGKWLWGWPNWTLAVFDGGMKISRINAVSPSAIDVHFQYFFADENSTEAHRRVIDATNAIFAEDVLACTRVQVNLASGLYRPGPLHPLHEQATAYFHSRVRSVLQ